MIMKIRKTIQKLSKHKIYICIFLSCLFNKLPVSTQFTFFPPRDSVERYVSIQVHLFPTYQTSLFEYANARADQFFVRMVL